MAILSVILLGVVLLASTFGIFLIPAASIIYLAVVAGYCRTLDRGEQVPYGYTRTYNGAGLIVAMPIAACGVFKAHQQIFD